MIGFRSNLRDNDETGVAIRAALSFNDRGSFLWKFAEPICDYYCVGGDDPDGLADPVRRAEFKRETAEFDVGFAERHEDARLNCFDENMTARWKALTIVLDHYRSHLPDNPVKLAQHYREMGMLAHDFTEKLGCERKMHSRSGLSGRSAYADAFRTGNETGRTRQ